MTKVNYLKNSMDDPRLSNLLLLYKSHDIVSKLDIKELMVKWHQEKSRRLPI
jgi:exonuclease I